MYSQFILLRAKPGQPTTSSPFQSPTPVDWTTARDRLQKAGLLDGYRAGSFSDGWMLSVDTHETRLVNPTDWKPLP